MRWLLNLWKNKLKAQPGKADALKTQIMGNSQVRIGRFTYGYEHAEVYQWGEGADLEIGSFCSIGGGLRVFLGGNHRIDWATTFPFGQVFRDTLGDFEIDGQNLSKGDVVIGNDVWIGADVTILSGARIGDGAVLATNATVAGQVEPYEMVGGNPAKHLKYRFDEDTRSRLESLCWWEQPINVIRRIAPLLSTAPDSAALDKVEAVIAEMGMRRD